MTKEQGTENSDRSFRGKALKAQILRVPVRWNKLTSHVERKTCREVDKTCGRGAARWKLRLTRSVMMALKGKKPRKVPESHSGTEERANPEVG